MGRPQMEQVGEDKNFDLLSNVSGVIELKETEFDFIQHILRFHADVGEKKI